MHPFFTVIIPIYNAQKTLKDAVNSILRQTYARFELILVNDGSCDESAGIIDTLADRDVRVHAIHLEENTGLSNARNAGLAHASGQYVQFMDADDEVEAELLETVYASLQENPAEVAVIGLKETYRGEGNRKLYGKTIVPERKLLRGADAVRREVMALERKTLFGYAWNKFYLREKIESLGLRYLDVPLIEDFLFNASFFAEAQSVNLLDIAAYHYEIRSGPNLTARYVKEYFTVHRTRIQTLYDLHAAWGLLTDDVKNALGTLYARYILSAVLRNCDPRAGMSHKERRAWLEAVYGEALFVELQPHMRSNAYAADWVNRLIAGRHTRLVLTAAGITGFVKRRLPGVFARLKQSK